ncbi:MAG: GNAT family N-acetyltransferase [Bacteroidetes bacterium]|nr:GNAT family N-acetyltransferase [Bacteroidota bacterium]
MNRLFHIVTLEDISLEQLTDTFNAAFSDYLVKLQLTTDQMLHKIKSENISMALSFGAFAGDELVGFILHGSDPYYNPGVLYNAGTGVVPAHRGKQIAGQLYTHAIEALSRQSFFTHQLEVAVPNLKAMSVYTKLGFHLHRKLVCFRGRPSAPGVAVIPVTQVNVLPWDELPGFWNHAPTWQNDIPAMQRVSNQLRFYAILPGGKPLAYAIVNPLTGRVHQLAVHPLYRRRGYAGALIMKIAEDITNRDLSMINIDHSDVATIAFLKACNLEPFIEQYELKLYTAN